MGTTAVIEAIGGMVGQADSREGAAGRLAVIGPAEINRAYRLAGLILGNASDAEDATQEALLRAWRAAASLRSVDGFDAWFDRILLNVCRDRLRRRTRIRWIALDRDAQDGVASDPFCRVLEHDALLGALEALDRDERAIVVLHYWGDLPLDEVARRMGTPLGTVKSRLHRALEHLRRHETSARSGEAGR